MYKLFPVVDAMKGWVLPLVFLYLSGILRTVHGITNPDEVQALVALQVEWNAASTLQWIGNDPCGDKWVGVLCEGQRVQSLVVTSQGLSGFLPVDVQFLSDLQTLDLSFNNLTGPIPTQLGKLTQLEYLILQSNSFSGSIPPELGQLQNLSYLYLTNNKLTGQIPHEVGLLKSLSWLDLAFNSLTGPLPYSSDGNNEINAGLDNLTNTKHFHLNNNKFSGSIPRSLCHSSMKVIHILLNANKLTGAIPPEIGQCSALVILKLDANFLDGQIPTQIDQLSDLNELQLGSNSLLGSLPNLSNLSSLQLLSLSNNTFDDVVPSWLPLLQSLTDLEMENAGLSGQIPGKLFALPDLTTVNFDGNSINGTLDLSQAGKQLMLVSVENNQIRSTNQATSQGQYSETLRLYGNPICVGSSSVNLGPTVCSSGSSEPPPSSSGPSCPTTDCPVGFTADPVDCSCRIPYDGVFTFRAPSFTTINATGLASFKSALAKSLKLKISQILLLPPTFDSGNQLKIEALIFPTPSPIWNRNEINDLSSLISQNHVSVPPGFGPSLFQPKRYAFTESSSRSSLGTNAKIGIGVGAAVLALVVCGLCCFAFLQKRRADKAVELSRPFASWGASGGESGDAPKLKGARWFSFAELKKATNNFSESNEVGSGGYGKVYRGILLSGEQVAIKRAQENSMQGGTEFKNEIELLSRVHHKNVVSLVGFCFEQGEQMLVYEYMANGTVREAILGRTGVKIDWRRRLMIALGAARGIAYLHELADPPIIHRDIKSSNILLDEKRIAKVADFGLSKIGPGEGEKGHVSTQVKGTVGYLDPEYYLSQQLTQKSDVYSYGVVLLELITARRPIEHGKYIVREVKTALEKKGIDGLRPMLDSRISDESLPELEHFVRIAIACVEESAANRPTMGELVKELEELVGHDYPESGSSNIEVGKGQPVRHPYGSDSEYMHTSKDSSDPSFPTSGRAFESR